MNTSFFGELLQTIAERGRSMVARRPRRPTGELRTATLVELCEALLSGRGEASGAALARDILYGFQDLKMGERVAFFETLARTFGVDRERLARACANYANDPTEAAAAAVHQAAEPRRQELIRRLNLAPGATEALVAMRSVLLDALARRRDLAPVDHDFTHLLSSWFNRGFLVLRKIDWSSPAIVLEKIIRYEAVHEIQDWDDLRARIDPPDRRCYAFFHPALVDEPLIFVEVALTADMPGAIAPILARKRVPIDPREATTAVFYSISNTQRGLTGVTFGSFLIKQVAEEISRELPNLSTFITLSPAPGFREWLIDELQEPESGAIRPEDRSALALLDEAGWHGQDSAIATLKPVLGPLAAHYFLNEKTTYGRPRDSVARFHLGNGARLERINLMADLSPKAIAQSAGVMVNYRYVLSDIEKNHEAYAETGEVVASTAVRRMLRAEKPVRAMAAQ